MNIETGMAKTFPPAERAWTRDVGPTAQQPTGIIKTMPEKFFKEYGMRRFLDHFYFRPNRLPDAGFWFTMSAKPKIEVLNLYLLVGGRIRFRANIAAYEGGGYLDFLDGTSLRGNAFILTGAPVVKPPRPIYMKGFRGFRYTEALW